MVGSIVGMQSEEIKQMAEEYEGKVCVWVWVHMLCVGVGVGACVVWVWVRVLCGRGCGFS